MSPRVVIFQRDERGLSPFETAALRPPQGDGIDRFNLHALAQSAPILFHSATVMQSRLKLWNESGTKRARIADSYRNPIRSPQHLALARSGGTRSSLHGLHKRRCWGQILKGRSRIRLG